MEARRLLEDYFSDVKLAIFQENRKLYEKCKGEIPLDDAARIAKQDVNILKSCLKDSKVFQLAGTAIIRKNAPAEPNFEELALVCGPFPKHISTQFIKHFALKTGQVCPMLVNSFMINPDFKASFFIFRSAYDKALFQQQYKKGKAEKDQIDFDHFRKLFEGIDDTTKIDNQMYSRLYKEFRAQCICYTPENQRVLGLKWSEEDHEKQSAKAKEKKKDFRRNKKTDPQIPIGLKNQRRDWRKTGSQKPVKHFKGEERRKGK